MRPIILILFSLSFISAVQYEKVWTDIVGLLNDPSHDDGSWGPLFIRLAWHSSGTYNKTDGTGGSHGATMRYNPEKNDPDNNGLEAARDRLEPLITNHPGLSHGDLWTFAAVVAVRELGGPLVNWSPGRVDATSEDQSPENGRLPAGNSDPHKAAVTEVYRVFNRMGFDDGEIVALMGAHGVGRCHKENSGFEGAWTNTPIQFNNAFYRFVNGGFWHYNKSENDWRTNGVLEDGIMLNADMAMVQHKPFKKYVIMFKENNELWRGRFAVAFSKLIHLGVPIEQPSNDWWRKLGLKDRSTPFMVQTGPVTLLSDNTKAGTHAIIGQLIMFVAIVMCIY